jgi:hypothetical protein
MGWIMRIVFSGVMGRDGLGGNAWSTLQYLLGFRELGHDVYYLEDCGASSFVWDWNRADWNYGLDYPAAHVHACLQPFGFGEKWIYRTDAESRGMPLEQFCDICRQTDLLVLRAAPLPVWRKEYEFSRRRVFVDVDPGFTQIAIANGEGAVAETLARCHVRFTVGQGIGAADCLIPNLGGPWQRTVPPVFLPEWPMVTAQATHFTSVVRWRTYQHHVLGRDLCHGGISYGQRDREFPKFLTLPNLTAQKFRLALMGGEGDELASNGWEVVSGESNSRTLAAYRTFIQQSRAEFAVPKQGYVQTRSGWFSDRSVCYLASGRPVVLEDTGMSNWLPVGEGLLAFHDLESAVAAVEEINRDYKRHQFAARAIAEDFFATSRVLKDFIDVAMQ